MTLAETIERLNNIMKIPGVKPEFEVVVEILVDWQMKQLKSRASTKDLTGLPGKS